MINMKKVNVIIATHKKYAMPKDKLYLPLHVGKEGKKSIGFRGDNSGKNISLKNLFHTLKQHIQQNQLQK